VKISPFFIIRRKAVWQRAAFTLVELLVVIAIIGMLVALLLPAINSARESGRRVQCANNEKQVGLALVAYQESMQAFPPGASFPPSETSPWTTSSFGPNWAIRILPFLEMDGLYKLFNLNKPISDPANAVARATPVPTMLCPSDINFNSKPYNPVGEAAQGPNWARGNYGANGSIEFMYFSGMGTSFIGPGSSGWRIPWIRGVMGINESSPPYQIIDGISQTCLLGELRAGIMPVDHRGVWAMGSCGASMLWGHGSTDDHGPNNPSPTSDDTQDCGEMQATMSANYLAEQGMGCDAAGVNIQATSRSLHPGGVNICMCDGSVHFISDEINCSTTWHFTITAEVKPEFGVWEELMSPGDTILIDGEAW
jgi:prepilin-type N-terminal cleavage/methylation domain-containing protein/prepilin-type processing-associated H-X9-DG protein